MDLLGGQGIGVDPDIVYRAVEVVAPVVATDVDVPGDGKES